MTSKVGGLRLAYERAGNGPPIVLLHGGFGLDHRAWRWQIAALADAFDVLAWDAPGCGRSSDPPAAPLSVGEDLHARIVGSELVVIPGAGHLSNAESPEQVHRSGAPVPARGRLGRRAPDRPAGRRLPPVVDGLRAGCGPARHHRLARSSRCGCGEPHRRA